MDELQRQLKAFSKTYGLRGQLMEDRIKALLAQGKSPKEAIEQTFKEFGVEEWLQASVSSALVATAKDALGADLVGELSGAVLLEALSNPWDGSGLTLSKKIHGTSESMKEVIVETVQNQIRLNKTVKDTAQALYDGYQHGSIVRQQDLPKYMDDLMRWTRRSRENLTEAERRDLQRAIRKVQAQADELVDDKSTYNHFRTALRSLLDKIDKGSEKSVQKAISAAIEEKSRYIAERIARTEAARARYDAFIARYGEDDSVVAYKWSLGSRHPVEDICDMYAEADLYGLGKGVFPKDKAPVCPAHPHCLCHYAPVYESELQGKKPSKDVEANGNAWLKKQPTTVQEKILGVKGRVEWKAGRASWMEKARNISPVFEKRESRLSEMIPYSRRKKVEITDETIKKIKRFKYPGLSDAQNIIMRERQKELLRFAKEENHNNEVAFLLDEKLNIIRKVTGNERATNLPSEILYCKWLLHNHPRCGGFSIDDVHTFYVYDSLKCIVAIGNNGHIQSLTKTSKYDSLDVKKVMHDFLSRLFSSENYRSGDEARRDVMMSEMMRPLLSSLQAQGLIIWKR